MHSRIAILLTFLTILAGRICLNIINFPLSGQFLYTKDMTDETVSVSNAIWAVVEVRQHNKVQRHFPILHTGDTCTWKGLLRRNKKMAWSYLQIVHFPTTFIQFSSLLSLYNTTVISISSFNLSAKFGLCVSSARLLRSAHNGNTCINAEEKKLLHKICG